MISTEPNLPKPPRLWRARGSRRQCGEIDSTPTEGGEPTYKFALFSRSGFKRSVEEAADEHDDLRLFDLSDIVAVLESGTTH